MNAFSLRTVIDDILLIVRNNNISESEDLSRALIAAWVLQYRASLIKKANDDDKKSGAEDSSLDSLLQTYGPFELINEESLDGIKLFTRRTKDPIPQLVDNSERNLYCVFDQEGCVILKMNEHRRHFHWFRKYTSRELTAYYERQNGSKDGYVYIQGNADCGKLKYIWISGLFVGSTDDDLDEDDITIPDWMVPDIKRMIMSNELQMMLRMPSDDDNNSTLDGIKPAGPQNEK